LKFYFSFLIFVTNLINRFNFSHLQSFNSVADDKFQQNQSKLATNRQIDNKNSSRGMEKKWRPKDWHLAAQKWKERQRDGMQPNKQKVSKWAGKFPQKKV
jgi:hypothetical protein